MRASWLPKRRDHRNATNENLMKKFPAKFERNSLVERGKMELAYAKSCATQLMTTSTRFKRHVFVPTFTYIYIFKGVSKQTTIWGRLVQGYEYALRGSFPAQKQTALWADGHQWYHSMSLFKPRYTSAEKHGKRSLFQNSNRLKSITGRASHPTRNSMNGFRIDRMVYLNFYDM